MTHPQSQEIANRFTIAAAELLRHPLDPAFADDGTSAVFVTGAPLDAGAIANLSLAAGKTGIDLVRLAFEPGREGLGPIGIGVFAERDGCVYRWIDCVLWAPKDDGPLLIMPRGLDVCFGYDGKALPSFPSRPTRALTAGIARARRRLHRAVRSIARESAATETMRHAA